MVQNLAPPGNWEGGSAPHLHPPGWGRPPTTYRVSRIPGQPGMVHTHTHTRTEMGGGSPRARFTHDLLPVRGTSRVKLPYGMVSKSPRATKTGKKAGLGKLGSAPNTPVDRGVLMTGSGHEGAREWPRGFGGACPNSVPPAVKRWGGGVGRPTPKAPSSLRRQPPSAFVFPGGTLCNRAFFPVFRAKILHLWECVSSPTTKFRW